MAAGAGRGRLRRGLGAHRLLRPGRGGGAGARLGVHPAAPRRVGPGAPGAPARAGRRSGPGLLRAAGRRRAGRLRASGARCCGARWPAWWTRRPSSGPACGPTPGPRSSTWPSGEGWRRCERRAGSGEADGVAAGDRGAARRLPRARRRDGHAEPGRRAGVRRRARRASSSSPSRGRGPATCRRRGTTWSCGPSRPAAARRRCASRSGSRWAAASGAGRPTPRPCCAGRAAPTSSVAAGLGSDVPFCLVGGRARVEGVGERVTPLPFEARDYLLLLPPFGVDTARVYRAWDEDPGNAAPNALAAAALAVEPRLAALARRPGGPGRARAGPGRQRLDLVRRGGTGGGRDAVAA